MEQTEREPASIKLPVCSLILGIIALVISFIGFFSGLFSTASKLAAELNTEILPAAGTVTIVLLSVGLLIGAIATVLGFIGIVRCARHPRTVKGIVLSAIGLYLGITALGLALYAFFVNRYFISFLQTSNSLLHQMMGQ